MNKGTALRDSDFKNGNGLENGRKNGDSEKEESILVGSGKFYKHVSATGSVRGQINIKGNVAPSIEFGNGEDLIIKYDKRTKTVCIERLSSVIKK